MANDKFKGTQLIADDANRVYDDARKLVTDVYQEGRHQFNDVQQTLRLQSKQLTQIIHEKPLSSILIAAGVGFILATLLRR